MRRAESWLAVVVAGALLALPLPAGAHPSIGLTLAELSAEIGHHPDDAELRVQRGELYRLNREWTLAEADFRAALALTPDDPDLQLHFGRLWFEAGDAGRALPALDRFLAAHPDHVEGLLVRGRAMGALGDPLAAARDYDRVIALLDPPEPEHYLRRARWLAAAGDTHVDAALRGIDDGIARLGPLVTLVAYAIDLEVGRARYDAALARFAGLPAVLAGRPDWLARRGDVLHAAGRAREASAAYAEALLAIEALPPKRRTIKATVALEARLRRLLGRGGTGG